MSKMFGNMKTDDLAETGDRIGGFGPVETDIYEATIKLVYGGKAANSDAQSVTVHYDVGGREVRETYWVTSKAGDNFYIDKQDNKTKHPLPGWAMMDDLALFTTGLDLTEQDTEEKTVNLYNFQQRQEVPTQVPVFMNMIGKKVYAGIQKRKVNKQQKGDDGKYHDIAETREENVVDKLFDIESKRTVSEIKRGIEEPNFYDRWLAEFRGRTIDRTNKNLSGNTGRPGAGGNGAGGPGAGHKPLFGNAQGGAQDTAQNGGGQPSKPLFGSQAG